MNRHLEYSKRVRRCIRMKLLGVVFVFAWLWGFGFLFLYILSKLDPNALSMTERGMICAVGVTALLLPLPVAVWNQRKLSRRNDLLCRNCDRDLAQNRGVIKYVIEKSACPFCGAHVD